MKITKISLSKTKSKIQMVKFNEFILTVKKKLFSATAYAEKLLLMDIP